MSRPTGVIFSLTGARLSWPEHSLSLQLAWIIMFKTSAWYYYYKTICSYELCSLQSAVCILLSVCILPRFAVRSLRFTLTIFNFITRKVEVKSKQSLYITKLHRPSRNIRPYRPFHKITTEWFKYIEQLNCWNFVSSIISTE